MSQLKKGRDLADHLVAPEGKVLIAVDTSEVDTLAFDIKTVSAGQLISGADKPKGTLTLFGPEFKVVRQVSQKDYHYLVMKEDNIEAFVGVVNE